MTDLGTLDGDSSHVADTNSSGQATGTTFPGASAETLIKTVAAPSEEQPIALEEAVVKAHFVRGQY
jgi:hypothetical protein